MKKKNKKYEDDIITFENKEEEIIDSYSDDFDIVDDEEILYEEEYEIVDEKEEKTSTPKIIKVEEVKEDNEITDYDDYDDYEETRKRKSPTTKKIKLIMNIIFTIIVAILVMVTVDVISVARYGKGPYFAIPIHTYDDGGTKEYYGIGYKVIKYNQLQGRRDKEIGFWSLPYNATPYTTKDVDLAIEFYEDETATYEKYYKKFVRITSTLQKVDKKNNKITIGYVDDEGKYTLNIYCEVVKDQKNLKDLKEGEPITIIGSVDKFTGKTKKQPRKLYIKNCFAEQ